MYCEMKDNTRNIDNKSSTFVKKEMFGFIKTCFSYISAAITFCIWCVLQLRFPFKWANAVGRTFVFGAITFIPVSLGRLQFRKHCQEGRAFDGIVFTAKNEVKLDLVLPKELHEFMLNNKKNNNHNNSTDKKNDGDDRQTNNKNNTNSSSSNSNESQQSSSSTSSPSFSSSSSSNEANDSNGKNTKKYPVVMLFSGGAWLIGRRLWMQPLGMHFSDAGYISVVPDYRQWPFGTMPDMINDALESFVWTFEQIGKPGSVLEFADPDQVFVLGQSAGAHICSMALIELAKLRRDQLALVARGNEGSDRPFLHTLCKGVPAAFIGVGGMFDLASTQRELHKKGLHRRVIKSMCNNEPPEKFCAKMRSAAVAQEARKVLEEDETMFAQEAEAKHNQQHFRKRSGEDCDRQNSVVDAADAAVVASGERFKRESSNSYSRLLTGEKSSVHFLPRFNLFVHGDLDRAAPVPQAKDMCALYNDAAARHAEELVGDEVEWNSHPRVSEESTKRSSDPFYILTPKAGKTTSELKHKRRVSLGGVSNSNSTVHSPIDLGSTQSPSSSSSLYSSSPAEFTSAFSSSANNNNHNNNSSSNNNFASMGTPTSSVASFSSMGDFENVEGTRSMFLSYILGTHTSIIVGDFFRKETNPPLIVAVTALRKTLDDLVARHKASKPSLNLDFVTPLVSSSSPSVTSAGATITTTSTMSNNKQKLGNTEKKSLLQVDISAATSAASSSMISNDDGAATPTRIHSSPENFVELFQKHYTNTDKTAFRNPQRPTIHPKLLWFAEYISYF